MSKNIRRVLLTLASIICILTFIMSIKYIHSNCNTDTTRFAEQNGMDSNKTLYTSKQTLKKVISINAMGDCTLGTYPEVIKGKSFMDVLAKNKNNFSYPFKNVINWTSTDNVSVVNLEGTLTDAKTPAEKTWRFKGPASYTEILKKGSIEVVNLANNHIDDYLSEGKIDTKKALKDAGIGYFSYDNVYMKETNGIKIAFIGYMVIDETKTIFKKIKKQIKTVRKNGADIVVCSYHWGIEYRNTPTSYQIKLGRYTIDSGADIVLGTHPHILEGIEIYKGRVIAYSLGNFVFGGNELLTDSKHKDIDTILLQIKISLPLRGNDGLGVSIIPMEISGDMSFNNYQPVAQKAKEKSRIYKKITDLSKKIKYGVKVLKTGILVGR